MPRNSKYVFDLADLQFKQVRLTWKIKILRIISWVAVSIVVSLFYGFIFRNTFGSPKEKLLNMQLENMKLQYSIIGRQLDNSVGELNSLRLSDDRRYRPVLDMDSIPESYRKAGYGGVDRFRDLTGYMNSDMLIAYRSRIESIKNQANIQMESFKSIGEMAVEWKREVDHQPMISPVDVKFRLGDGFKFREVHPVLGTPRMHYGQDFCVPYGTDVYATGDGTVIESGWNSGGFGNYHSNRPWIRPADYLWSPQPDKSIQGGKCEKRRPHRLKRKYRNILRTSPALSDRSVRRAQKSRKLL